MNRYCMLWLVFSEKQQQRIHVGTNIYQTDLNNS